MRYVVIDDFLTTDECNALIGDESEYKTGLLENGPVLLTTRCSAMKPIWDLALHQRMIDAHNKVRESFRGLGLTKYAELMGVTKYNVGDKYDPHCDLHPDPTVFGSKRLLTFVMFLNDYGSEYTGGELVMIVGDERVAVPMKKGSAVLFLPSMLHEVTKIESGQRHTLVGHTFSVSRNDHRRPSV